MIDWDQVDSLHEEALNDLAAVAVKLRDAESLTENEARHLSIKAQVALNTLSLQRPAPMMQTWPFPDPEPETEEPDVPETP